MERYCLTGQSPQRAVAPNGRSASVNVSVRAEAVLVYVSMKSKESASVSISVRAEIVLV